MHSSYKNTGMSGCCHQVHRQYGTSHQFPQTTQKTATAFTFGGSLALDSPQRMPLSLLSLSELELSKYSLAYSLPVLSRGRYHGE